MHAFIENPLLFNCPDKPKIECRSPEVRIGDVDVYISCRVNAKPPPTALHWIVDPNGTILSVDGSSTSLFGHLWTTKTDVCLSTVVSFEVAVFAMVNAMASKEWKNGEEMGKIARFNLAELLICT